MNDKEYYKTAPKVISNLLTAYNCIEHSEISILAGILVSKINNCHFCIDFHIKEAQDENISPNKIEELWTYAVSTYFSEKEKLGLAWAEALTHTRTTQFSKLGEKMMLHFSQKELVELSASIAITNAFNRITAGLEKFDYSLV
jgi:AhpD family alkylhydroperoxidase